MSLGTTFHTRDPPGDLATLVPANVGAHPSHASIQYASMTAPTRVAGDGPRAIATINDGAANVSPTILSGSQRLAKLKQLCTRAIRGGELCYVVSTDWLEDFVAE